MQPINSKQSPGIDNSKENNKIEDNLTAREAITSALTVGAVLTALIFHREIGEFLGIFAKRPIDLPESLVTTFNIDPLNQYSPILAKNSIILPRELEKLPLLVCVEVQKIAKSLCSNFNSTTEDACSNIEKFCADLPTEGFIEKIGNQLSRIEDLLKKSSNFISPGYQLNISLKKLSSPKEITRFFCIINPDEDHSIVKKLKTHLHDLMSFAAFQSSKIDNTFIPAQHLQINPNNPMNRILHFGATS
jgi:hypothetical protein